MLKETKKIEENFPVMFYTADGKEPIKFDLNFPRNTKIYQLKSLILSHNGNRPFFLEFNMSNDDTFKRLMEINEDRRKLLNEDQKLIKIFEI